MRRMPLELLAGLLLLVGAVGADRLWYRPGKEALAAAETAYRAEVRKSAQARARFDRELAMESYLVWDTNQGDWLEYYRSRDPLELLNDLFDKSPGVRRSDLRLLEHKSSLRLDRTRYFVNVTGSFSRTLEFLRTLESATPLVTVDSFVMEDRSAGSGLELRINLSVLTARKEGA